MQFKMLNK